MLTPGNRRAHEVKHAFHNHMFLLSYFTEALVALARSRGRFYLRCRHCSRGHFSSRPKAAGCLLRQRPPTAQFLNFIAGAFDGPLSCSLQPVAARNVSDRKGRVARVGLPAGIGCRAAAQMTSLCAALVSRNWGRRRTRRTFHSRESNRWRRRFSRSCTDSRRVFRRAGGTAVTNSRCYCDMPPILAVCAQSPGTASDGVTSLRLRHTTTAWMRANCM
jgi:hypothetical protein